jgi:hypothetical protein
VHNKSNSTPFSLSLRVQQLLSRGKEGNQNI